MKTNRTLFVSAMCLFASQTISAPLFPTITGHDFNFGAFNRFVPPEPWEWQTNGFAPDTLTYVRETELNSHHEVTGYWPAWPFPPVFPVYNGPTPGHFGGDFLLYVQFTGQDAPYVGPGGTIDVSLTGTGNRPGADLEIWGSIGAPGPAVLLWALDLEVVSLYGYSNWDAYVLEGAGVIVGGEIPDRYQLIGKTGVMRGNLDFLDRPGGWIPPLYHPLQDPRETYIRAAYSGETGVGFVPEPVSLTCLALGLGLLGLRRRAA